MGDGRWPVGAFFGGREVVFKQRRGVEEMARRGREGPWLEEVVVAGDRGVSGERAAGDDRPVYGRRRKNRGGGSRGVGRGRERGRGEEERKGERNE